MTYDLKITGGTIVDGTGKLGFVGDVGISNGKIVALGKADGPATTTIDATGRIVAPGFVDVHTHYDAQVLWDRMLSISPWHGVTTTVIGNCGFGVAPTRAAHRKMILQTLEKVEGMSFDSLKRAWATTGHSRPSRNISMRSKAAAWRSMSRPCSATRRCASTPWARPPPSAPRRRTN